MIKHLHRFLTILILIFTSCQTSRQVTKSPKLQFKEIYIEQIKLIYLKQLLIKAYNNSEEIKSVVSLDRSAFTELILTKEDYKLIDSLTTADNIKLTIDSTNSIGKVAEGAEGKHTFHFIIYRFQSKWLDSLANRRYAIARNWIKGMYLN